MELQGGAPIARIPEELRRLRSAVAEGSKNPAEAEYAII
jgi:hypothetical protein